MHPQFMETAIRASIDSPGIDNLVCVVDTVDAQLIDVAALQLRPDEEVPGDLKVPKSQYLHQAQLMV